MADVQRAVEYVLREEDSTLSGAVTETRGDTGGKTRFGLASKWHPELLATMFYTTMPTADALQIAMTTLEKDFAAPLRIAEIQDPGIAVKFLSFGVNAGLQTAVRAMQYAVNCVYPAASADSASMQIRVDGAMGAETIAAVNRCMAQSLLNSFRLRMCGYYASICRANVSQREFLCGWIDRALA
ncbi:MAG: putative peptidoglycan-binding domain-containing protein [Acidobacteriaceae bacterium]